MTVTLHNTELDRVRNAVQCLRQIGPSAGGGDNSFLDADILNLTTVVSLLAAIDAKPKTDSETVLRHREALEAVTEMGDRGVFDTTNITAADTFAGLILILTTLLPTSEAEVVSTYYGGTLYLGNGGPLSTL